MNATEGISDSKRLTFTIEEDIYLLKQIKKENLFSDTGKWDLITDNMLQYSGKKFTAEAIKRHINYLLNLYDEKGFLKHQKKHAKNSILLEEREELIKDVANLKFISKLVIIQPKHKIKIDNSSQSGNKEKVSLENTPEAQKNQVKKPEATSSKTLQVEREKKKNVTKNEENEILLKAMKYDLKKKNLKLEQQKVDLEKSKLSIEKEKMEIHKMQHETIKTLVEKIAQENNTMKI